jgi:hypothetical protein
MEEKIIEAYKEMLITGEGEINSFTISKKVGISEKDFFQHFNSADDIARKIWSNLADTVIDSLNGSELFSSYPPRQKILSYYFTFFETALSERSFIEATINKSKSLKTYKEKFKQFVSDIVQEGIAVEDIKERLTLSNYYPEVLWQLHVRILHFWLKDVSDRFVETEKAIEVGTHGSEPARQPFRDGAFRLRTPQPSKNFRL